MSISLFLAVPFLLLPVVGLLAFAGCRSFGAADPVTPPVPPARPIYPEVVAGTVGFAAHWRLADPPGSLIARDVGPSTLNGRYVDGPPDVERAKPGGVLAGRDPDDRCAGFPGEKAHVVVDHSVTLNPGAGLLFSFEVWARLRNPAAREGTSEHLAASRLFAGPDQPNGGWDLFVTYGPGGVPTFTARVFSGLGDASTSAPAIAQSLTTPPDGAWHHVVMTYDGRDEGTVAVTVRLLGEPEVFPKVANPAPYAPNPSAPLSLGAGLFFGAYSEFEGDLDEAAFYNGLLSSEDIRIHHAAASP